MQCLIFLPLYCINSFCSYVCTFFKLLHTISLPIFLFIFCLLRKVTNRVMKKLLNYESLLIKVVISRKKNCFRPLEFFVLYNFRNRANPGEVSTDSSFAKIKNIILNTHSCILEPNLN